MPGPDVPFKAGAVYFGCSTCQGVEFESTCSCCDWLLEWGIDEGRRERFEFGLDEALVPLHMHNYGFGPTRLKGCRASMNFRKFTDLGMGGLQIVGITKQGDLGHHGE